MGLHYKVIADVYESGLPMKEKTIEWITVKEAADKINAALGEGTITEPGVRWLCREKRLASKRPGRDWFVDSASVQTYIQKRKS